MHPWLLQQRRRSDAPVVLGRALWPRLPCVRQVDPRLARKGRSCGHDRRRVIRKAEQEGRSMAQAARALKKSAVEMDLSDVKRRVGQEVGGGELFDPCSTIDKIGRA